MLRYVNGSLEILSKKLLTKFAYLLVDMLSISIPLLRSFEHRVRFIQHWKAILVSIAIPGAIFLIWDVYYTHIGVWGFNPDYLVGITLVNLPVEEWLFFVCIPYACIFTHEALKYFIPTNPIEHLEKWITYGLLLVLFVVGLIHVDNLYTGVTFIACGAALALLKFVLKAPFLSRFYFSFLVILIPFFIVNGILTGSFIPEQIVWYNDDENMGIRMGTIPVEDTFYGMLLLIMNISLFEYLKKPRET